MAMNRDTEELYPSYEKMSERSDGFHVNGSVGRKQSRFGLLEKIVAGLGLVVLALFIATIVLGLKQQYERTTDLKAQVQRKSQLLKALTKLEHQIKSLENRSSVDETDQASKKAKLLQALDKMRVRLGSLGNNTAYSKQSDYCPLKYNGTCTWLELRSSGIRFKEATELCAEQGGVPANIYSRDHFYMLMGYTTMFAFRKGWMEAWLGMSYNIQNNSVTLSDGNEAPFTRWHPGYPKTTKCCQLGLNADVDQADDSQDMFTVNPTTLLRGVLCEK